MKIKPEILSLIVTLVRLTSYHSGEQVLDWLRQRCATDRLINVREYTAIKLELERLRLPWRDMNMGQLVAAISQGEDSKPA